jgi:hypothetical protein
MVDHLTDPEELRPLLDETAYWITVLPAGEADQMAADLTAILAIAHSLDGIRNAAEAHWRNANAAGRWQSAAAWLAISDVAHDGWISLGAIE